TPELVYKVLGVPLGGEDINRMNRLKYLEKMLKSAERVKNDVSKKKKDSSETKQDWLLIRTRGSLKVLYNLMKNLSPAQMKDIIDIVELIKKREIFEISNGGFGLLHLYSDDSSDDDIFEREKVTLLKLIVEDLEFEFLNCLMDHPNSSRLKDIKAKYNGIIRNTDLSDFGYAIEDNSIHHESEYGNVFSEMDNSLNFNDMSGNYNVGECSHGVEELDNDFINETNEENGEDILEEEMIEENEEQMFMKRTHEEKEEEILNQDSIEVNVLKVNEANNMAEKSTQDDIQNEFRKNDKKETSFDFKMFDIPKLDDKEKSAVGGFEDCLMKGLFRQDAQPDNSVRSFGNPFRVSTSDMSKHKLDEPSSFSLGPEFDDFSIEEINQTNVKDESRVAFSKTESHCSQ
nr:hypothetical protein [Tanacetum cinerariifolium]